MNKVLNAYADVDSLFDYRRALIQKFITSNMYKPEGPVSDEEADLINDRRKLEGDKLWDLYIAKDYLNRRMDTFEYPFFNMKKGDFTKLFKERSIKDWVFGYYPTNFMNLFLKVIIDHEQLTEAPIGIKTVVLHINTFPYEFDEELNDSLLAHCRSRFSGRVDVKIISADIRSATVNFYKQYDYVFKYDLMLNPDYKPLFDSISKPPIPNTTFLVPDILVMENDDFEGAVGDLIFASSLSVAAVFKIVPIDRSFYDYET